MDKVKRKRLRDEGWSLCLNCTRLGKDGGGNLMCKKSATRKYLPLTKAECHDHEAETCSGSGYD